MNFVNLHTANGTPITINMNFIESYGVISPETYGLVEGCIGLTYLVPAGMPSDEKPYIVRETPDEIAAMF